MRTILVALLAFAAWAAGPETVAVWKAGEGGYHTYRIPAVIATSKGTLLAFCEGRKDSSSDSGNIDLLVKRSTDGGTTWGPAITVADPGTDTIGNPAPVVEQKTGVIWLPMTRNPGRDTEAQILSRSATGTRTVWITHSNDDGRTWAPPVEITAAVKPPSWTWYATGPGNGIQLRSGRMVIPCDHNEAGAEDRYSHVIYSDDRGKTWKLGGSAGPKCNESAVVERHDGSLLLNMRSYAGKNRRAVSVSRDGGLTWTPPKLDDALIEPVCQASMIRFGKLLLFSNPASTERRNMTVKLSRDEGENWPVVKAIYAGPSAYSSLVELPGRIAGLLYERGEQSPYEEIVFARIGEMP